LEKSPKLAADKFGGFCIRQEMVVSIHEKIVILNSSKYHWGLL
jgi:hypothetical protein